jgi:recombination protein U
LNSGKVFENNFKKSVPENIYYMRMKDSPSSFSQQNGGVVRFTSNNPYDNFMFYKYHFFPFELKSTQSTSFSIQMEKMEKGKDIKLHQIQGLTIASEYEGICAGFILDFRKSDNTYFLNIKEFNKFLARSDKKSINEKDVFDIGGILIEKKLKKINYTYNIEKLMQDILHLQ